MAVVSILFLYLFRVYCNWEGIVKSENCLKSRTVEANVFMLEEKRHRGHMLKVFRYWKEISLRGNRLIIFPTSLNCKYWWEVTRGQI